MKRMAAVLVVAGLAVAGCGSGSDGADGDDGPPDITATATVPPTTADPYDDPTDTTEPDRSSDLEDLLLTPEEIGPSWAEDSLAPDDLYPVGSTCLDGLGDVANDYDDASVTLTDETFEFSEDLMDAGPAGAVDVATIAAIFDACPTVAFSVDGQTVSGPVTPIGGFTFGEQSKAYEIALPVADGTVDLGLGFTTVRGFLVITTMYTRSAGGPQALATLTQQAVAKLQASGASASGSGSGSGPEGDGPAATPDRPGLGTA